MRPPPTIMLRVVLFQLFLFLLPFIGFGIYVWVTRGLAAAQSSFGAQRIVWLAISGGVLMAGGLIALAVFGGAETGQYVPLRFEDGQLIRGGFQDRE